MATNTTQFSGEFIAKPSIESVAKKKRSTKPPAVKAAVLVGRANGKGKRQLARELGIGRPTVDAIIAEANFDQLIENGELGCANLIHKAINVVDKRLDKESESAATFILSNTVFSDKYSKQGQRMKADTILQVAINNLIQPAKAAAPGTKVIEASSNNSTKTEQD